MKLLIIPILLSIFLFQARSGDCQTTTAFEEGGCANVTCTFNQQCVPIDNTDNETECRCIEGYEPNANGTCVEGLCTNVQCLANQICVPSNDSDNGTKCQCSFGYVETTDGICEQDNNQTAGPPEETSGVEPNAAGDGQTTELPEESSGVEPTVAGDVQTTESPEESSGVEPTTADTGVVEPTGPDVCANVQCPENQQCVPTENADSGTECQCSEGYVSSDNNCIQGCRSEQVVVLNSAVHQDVVCSNLSYTPEDVNITVIFVAVATGSFSSANLECNQACNERPREIGALECLSNGQWSEPTWTNCSRTQEQQTAEEQSDNALISTSDPAGTSSTDVDNAVSDVNSVANSAEVISSEVVQTIVFVVSNVFRVTQESAQGAVGNSLTVILDLLVIVSTKVTLTTDRGGATSWEYEVVNVAVCVIGISTVQRNEPDTRTWYYGPANGFDSDLSKSVMSLSETEPKNTPYMSAAAVGAERLIFTMFSEVAAFKLDELPGLLTQENVVYKFDGASEVTLIFQINRNITVDASNRFNETTTNGQTTYEKLQVVIWNGTDIGWIPADCHSYSAGGGFANATCTGPGEFTITSEIVTEPSKTEVGSFSAGEIAGIVIGSLVVGGSIAGLAVYLVMSKKKKKKSVIGGKKKKKKNPSSVLANVA